MVHQPFAPCGAFPTRLLALPFQFGIPLETIAAKGHPSFEGIAGRNAAVSENKAADQYTL